MRGQLLTVLCPGGIAPGRLSRALEAAGRGRTVRMLTGLEPGKSLRGQRLLFAAALPEDGVNPALYALLSALRRHPGALEGCTGGIVIDGAGDLYTKAAARELALSANLAGCQFVGRPLVEATGDLRNFTVQARNGDCSLEEAYRRAAADLAQRVCAFAPPKTLRPRLAVLHASSHATSNTLALWGLMKAALEDRCDVTEIGLRNGTLEDCAGCPYTACLHFGEAGGCFYGGVMVQEVYPAIRECDAVVVLCPNYNDALSANLTAAVNRLTALYRTTSFAGKAVYTLAVSGYSGGDIVASQTVGALCMNKGFYLPARFCRLATANDAGEALRLPGIREEMEEFARQMLAQLRP